MQKSRGNCIFLKKISPRLPETALFSGNPSLKKGNEPPRCRARAKIGAFVSGDQSAQAARQDSLEIPKLSRRCRASRGQPDFFNKSMDPCGRHEILPHAGNGTGIFCRTKCLRERGSISGAGTSRLQFCPGKNGSPFGRRPERLPAAA